MAITVLGIAGGSGSGKTTLARKIAERLGEGNCLVVSQDSYYVDQSDKFTEDGGDINFDHPDSLEFTLLAKHVAELKVGNSIEIPRYDFSTHKRLEKGVLAAPKRVILVDGTLVLSQSVLLPHFDYSIFVDVDGETRYSRRLKRDTSERGRLEAGVLKQWTNHVAPMHEEFVAPSKSNADLVVRNDESFEQCILDITLRFSD